MSDGSNLGNCPSEQAPPASRNPALGRAVVPASSASRRGFRVFLRSAKNAVVDYFASNDPVFVNAFAPALFLAAFLYVRSPVTNCIFDEQEALLANPYVNGGELKFLDAFKRDFWGLPSTRSIGSYRPLPNLIWRLLWPLGNSPWLLHWANVVIHAASAALLASFVWSVTKQRRLGWWTGLIYVSLALLTEAVSGVVGLADMLGALFIILALHALHKPWFIAAPAIFLSILAGFFSKESELVAIPLVAAAALFTARALHPRRPLAILRAAVVLLATVAALVVYTEVRRRNFPVELPSDLAHPLDSHAAWYQRAMHAFLRWFRQPRLPADPMNNPLVRADLPHRIAGALRVYASGLGQLVLPLRLSGDYSFPAEPIPPKLVFPGSVLGAFALLAPPIAAFFGLCVVVYREWRIGRATRRELTAQREFATQPVRELTAQPVREFATQPVREFAAQPVRELTAQPVRELTAQPVRE
ncbi:MAG: hypothetical protein ACM3ZE_20720, partial [Myxococcales bacterium]